MNRNNIIALTSLLMFLNIPSYATPVNINTADANNIAESLNGIGLVKAQAVVEYRKQNGNYTNIESLSSVKGIGQKTIEKNKKDIQL